VPRDTLRGRTTLVGSAPPSPVGALAERFSETHAAGVYVAAGEASGRTAVPPEAAIHLAVRRAPRRRSLEFIPRRIPQKGGSTPVGATRRAAVYVG
jgi:hypothetical protein